MDYVDLRKRGIRLLAATQVIPTGGKRKCERKCNAASRQPVTYVRERLHIASPDSPNGADLSRDDIYKLAWHDNNFSNRKLGNKFLHRIVCKR